MTNLTRSFSRPTTLNAQAAELHKQALEADSAIFDYDGHFDGFQDSRKQKLKAADDERINRKSRYIESLIAKQKEREREQDIIYERRLLKEREKEDREGKREAQGGGEGEGTEKGGEGGSGGERKGRKARRVARSRRGRKGRSRTSRRRSRRSRRSRWSGRQGGRVGCDNGDSSGHER